MGLNSLGLGLVFTARDLASGASSNLERNFMSLDKRVGLGTESIQSSFQQLGVGLGVFTAGAATVGVAAARFRDFGLAGERVGRVLAGVFGLLVQSMTVVAEVAQGMAEGWQWVSAGADVLRDALAELGAKVADITDFLFGGASVLQGYGSAWRLGALRALLPLGDDLVDGALV